MAGDAWTAGVLVAVLLAVMALEHALTTRGWDPWFRLGFPLGAEPLAVTRAPTAEGERAGLVWVVVDDGAGVVFHVRGGQLPRGLHGYVRLLPDRMGRVHLDVTWSPWWTPMVAFAWLSVLGVSRGDGVLMVPLAVALSAATLWLYWQAAARAVAVLRFAFDDEEPTHSQGGRPS